VKPQTQRRGRVGGEWQRNRAHNARTTTTRTQGARGRARGGRGEGMRVGAPPREGGARVRERARKRAHHPPAQGQKHAKVTVSRGGDAKAKQAQSSSTHAPQRAGWHGTGAPSRITGARCAERGETRDNHHAGSERGDAWPQRMCARGQELSRRYRRKCMASHLGVGRRA
jgi:hypothetical protein